MTDDEAVDKLAEAMKAKLREKSGQGRGGWQDCRSERLSAMLRDHVEKGDPVDVANFCAFLFAIGWQIEKPRPVCPRCLGRGVVIQAAFGYPEEWEEPCSLCEGRETSPDHWSDCATNNAPAYEPGPCDCAPTPAMCRAAVEYVNGSDVYEKATTDILRVEEDTYHEIWRVMQAAAPCPLRGSK